jgi:nucleoside-diphosphate-sugar epimerase
MQNRAKVLITGSGGFIGSHLISSLESFNTDIFKLPHKLLQEPLDLEKQIKEFKPDVIYHLSAYGNMGNQKDEAEILSANIGGTWNLLQATKDLQYKLFINFSTSSVLLPHQTMYSATKLGAEALCKAFVDEYKKPIVTVRPYSIYGDGEAEFRFIPTVIRSLLYGETMELTSESRHDWVFVDDLVNSLIGLTPGFVNLGTGYSYSNIDIVRKLELISGRKLKFTEKKLRSFDTREWVCPEHTVISDIDQGLLKTYLYYVKRFTSN